MTFINDSADYFTQLAATRNPLLIKSQILREGSAKNSKDWNFIMGQNDKGVELNRGRIGARDAGRVILHHFSMMLKPQSMDFSFYCNLLANNKNEIPSTFWSKNLLHLGSGHDHVFHLLNLALTHSVKNFFIINLDAHADMRKDNLLHSGTPFRYFFEQHKKQISQYHLYQFGLNPYYQNPSDLELKGAQVKTLWQQDFTKENILKSLKELKLEITKNVKLEETLVLVSLDADVISSNAMSAVSAVNPRGISQELIIHTLKTIKDELKEFNPLLGIYEYNPMFDDISGRGAKLLASLVYDWIFPCHSNNS